MASNLRNLAHEEEEASHSTPIFRPSIHSTNEDFLTSSTPLGFKGIPFSWEQIPGIPKHQHGSKKKEYSDSCSEHLLPLPPPAAKKLAYHEEISPKKSSRFQRDPFFAALVECSKDRDDHRNIWKGNYKNDSRRSLSDRFGFMMNSYGSCKSACAVSEAVVYVRPRSRAHYLLNHSSR